MPKSELTQNEVELGLGLEGVVHGDEEGRLADGLEDAALRLESNLGLR